MLYLPTHCQPPVIPASFLPHSHNPSRHSRNHPRHSRVGGNPSLPTPDDSPTQTLFATTTPVIPASFLRHSRVGGNPSAGRRRGRESTAPTPNAPLPTFPPPPFPSWFPVFTGMTDGVASFSVIPASFSVIPAYAGIHRPHAKRTPSDVRPHPPSPLVSRLHGNDGWVGVPLRHSRHPSRHSRVGGNPPLPTPNAPLPPIPTPLPPWFPVFTGMTDGVASFSVIPATTSVIPA